jgi:hypothetical protein
VQRKAAELLERKAGVPGRLSVKALQYAAALPPLSSSTFADRLYRYHSLPRASLTGVRSDALRFAVRGHWRTASDRGSPWLTLSRDRKPNGRWKLYLSPAPADLYECARRALPALTSSGAQSLKFGRDDAAILRPDRFVAYFSDHAALAEAATELRAVLNEFDGLGVPFTSPFGNGRLLSWGLDLSRGRARVISWRYWVVSELGSALFAHSRDRERNDDSVEFALRHLEHRGLTLSGFCPGPSLRKGLKAPGVVP